MGETLLILASGWMAFAINWVVGRGGVHASLSISALYLNVETGVPSDGWKSIATCYGIL